ncbi:hypothetical protein KM043_014455 [Ampulex compressa]|nr:hypothetical protein KM043_014455 [Ampulex compressa]
MWQLIVFLTICTLSDIQATNLETVNDDDFLNLVKTEKYVIVLFIKKDCEACDNLENELIHLREDFVDTLSAWVIKVQNSQLLRLYSIEKEPALLFFRHGLPLLYDGPLNDESILNMFVENKEPTVKELTDDTFEHLTQASSGATTGDWFIMFYSVDCVECLRMMAKWESVGAKLKHRMNVARIDRYGSGITTARRFNVHHSPEFIFFRHGKMYRYQIHAYEISNFVSFALEWYKNARAEQVPVPQTPFDDLVQMSVNILRDNPWIMKLGSISIVVLVIISVASKLRHKSEAAQKID